MRRCPEPRRHLLKADAVSGRSRARRFFHLDRNGSEGYQLALTCVEPYLNGIGPRGRQPLRVNEPPSGTSVATVPSPRNSSATLSPCKNSELLAS